MKRKESDYVFAEKGANILDHNTITKIGEQYIFASNILNPDIIKE